MESEQRREAYRHWAAQQPALMPFHQPAWLDIVAPRDWTATAAEPSFSAAQWAWPYLVRRRLSAATLVLPPATPYLGPWLPAGATMAQEVLPQGVAYGVFTVHQPAAAWSYGTKTRAMASQQIDLRQNTSYDSDLQRRLRRGAEQLHVRDMTTRLQLQEAIALCQANPHAAHPDAAQHLYQAEQQNFGNLLGVYSGHNDQLQGICGVLYGGGIAYVPLTLRSSTAHPSTTTLLIDAQIRAAQERSCTDYNFCSGFLPGVRDFHARFGAVPCWYGQVRLAANVLWQGLETWRALTNKQRR